MEFNGLKNSFSKVFVEGLECQAVIGVYPEEKIKAQPLVIDLVLFLGGSSLSTSDLLHQTVDYDVVQKKMKEWIESSRYDLLETLSEELCKNLFESFPLAEAITLRLAKPTIIKEARSVGVEIHRTRKKKIVQSSEKLEFWFEFASSYSYLSVMRIAELCKVSNLEIEWKPFLLGPIFKESGWVDSPFNIYPAKGKYMWRDIERRAAKNGIRFTKPTHFPRNGLMAARIACLAAEEGWIVPFVRGVFQANFVHDLEIDKKEVLSNILSSLGRSPQQVFDCIETEKIKDKLRCQTEEAQKKGVFGAPTFIVRNELFWGDDRLEEAIEWAAQL